MDFKAELNLKLDKYSEDKMREHALRICKQMLSIFDSPEHMAMVELSERVVGNNVTKEELETARHTYSEYYNAIYSGMEAPSAEVLAYGSIGELAFKVDKKVGSVNSLICAVDAVALAKAEGVDDSEYDDKYDQFELEEQAKILEAL